jgi:hypothetical protein
MIFEKNKNKKKSIFSNSQTHIPISWHSRGKISLGRNLSSFSCVWAGQSKFERIKKRIKEHEKIYDANVASSIVMQLDFAFFKFAKNLKICSPTVLHLTYAF